MKTTGKFKLRINADLCKGCRLCVEFCSEEVLAMTTDRVNAAGIPFAECVGPERCTGCRGCTVICPEAAIELFRKAQQTSTAGGDRGG